MLNGCPRAPPVNEPCSPTPRSPSALAAARCSNYGERSRSRAHLRPRRAQRQPGEASVPRYGHVLATFPRPRGEVRQARRARGVRDCPRCRGRLCGVFLKAADLLAGPGHTLNAAHAHQSKTCTSPRSTRCERSTSGASTSLMRPLREQPTRARRLELRRLPPSRASSAVTRSIHATRTCRRSRLMATSRCGARLDLDRLQHYILRLLEEAVLPREGVNFPPAGAQFATVSPTRTSPPCLTLDLHLPACAKMAANRALPLYPRIVARREEGLVFAIPLPTRGALTRWCAAPSVPGRRLASSRAYVPRPLWSEVRDRMRPTSTPPRRRPRDFGNSWRGDRRQVVRRLTGYIEQRDRAPTPRCSRRWRLQARGGSSTPRWCSPPTAAKCMCE